MSDYQISLHDVEKIPDRDIADTVSQVLADRVSETYKHNTLYQDTLLWIGRAMQRRGVLYTEISDTSLVKKDAAPYVLEQIHEVMPKIYQETGVRIRFLAAIRRIPLTIIKDRVTPNDYLQENFNSIMDYGFTARVEQDFDKIAEGKTDWNQMMTKFYKQFEPTVEKVIKSRSEHKAGERQLGIDPKTGKPVFVKIGRFGPVVQIGAADDKEKPRFAQLPTDKSMETVTLEDALGQFQLPRTVGQFEEKDVVIGVGRFGPYIMHDKKFVSLPKSADPMTITLDESVALIQEKRQQEEKRHLKTFAEDPKLEVLNGRYGPYIAYDGKNYRLPKNLHARAAELSYDEAMKIVKK